MAISRRAVALPMAKHKNQHFVPRCHFRPFSKGGEGKAINLFNIERQKVVEDAPVRGQCARPYLYSKSTDLGLEKLLQQYEGPYAQTVKRVEDGDGIDEAGIVHLFMSAAIQQARTEGAISQRRQAFEMMRSAASEGVLGERMEAGSRPSDHQLARDSIRDSAFHAKYLTDLRGCIVDNQTDIEFVTSDDPAVFTNRWMLQRHRRNNFGFANTGALWFMPLSPRKLFLAYDTQAYSIPGRRGYFLTITKAEDAAALNEFQYIKAISNVYFANASKSEEVIAAFGQAKPRRREDWFSVHVLVPDGKTTMGTRYRPATHEERQTAREKMLNLQRINPVPSRWLSGLQYRNPVKYYDNGSAIGPVRQRDWLKPTSRPWSGLR